MTQHLLGYFCVACVVLFFRRLCSVSPKCVGTNMKWELWWIQTLALMVAWPVLAPLCGAYTLGKAARKSITGSEE